MRNRFERLRPAVFAVLFLIAAALSAAGCAGGGGNNQADNTQVQLYTYPSSVLERVQIFADNTCENLGVPAAEFPANNILSLPLPAIPADPAFEDPRLTFLRVLQRRSEQVFVSGQDEASTATDFYAAKASVSAVAQLGGVIPFNIRESIKRAGSGGDAVFDYDATADLLGPGVPWVSSPAVRDPVTNGIVEFLFELRDRCFNGRPTGTLQGSTARLGGLAAFQYVPPPTAGLAVNADGLAFDTIAIQAGLNTTLLDQIPLFAVGGSLSVDDPIDPATDVIELPFGVQRAAYDVDLNDLLPPGVTAPVEWSYAGGRAEGFAPGGLPVGLELTPEGRLFGVPTGVPTNPLGYLFKAVARDGVRPAANYAAPTFELSMFPELRIITLVSEIPDGDVDSRYFLQFAATGGTGNYVWSVIGLPDESGLDFTPTGLLSGIPLDDERGSTYVLDVTVQDVVVPAATDTLHFSIFIDDESDP